MTQDEIIEMARDSGMELYGLGKNRARFVYHLEAFANLVAAKALAQTQEPVAWPCEIEEADFEQDTITLKMLTSEYVIRAGKHWLSTTPPQRTEQNFCPRCGKRTKDLTTIHTCTPPQD